MYTRNPVPRALVVFLIVAATCNPAVAGPVRIYGRDNFNKPIPADSKSTRGLMDDAIIEVTDHFIIQDLNVHITINHSKVFDLQLFLQSPAGTRVCLNFYNPQTEYFEGKNYLNTIFDDEALLGIEDGQAPFAGRFKPRAPVLLSAFDGEDVFGTWRLQVEDSWPMNTGVLKSFKMKVEVPEPTSAILWLVGLGLVGKSRRTQGH